jgi:hypothetical protein
LNPSRRRLLLGGAATVGLMATLGAAVALQPTLHRAPRAALRVLDARQFSVLAALADRVCPGGGGLPSAWELQVPEKVDLLLDSLHPATAAELQFALGLVESGLAGLLLDGRIRAFTRCPPEVQDAVLATWRDSRLPDRRIAYRALVSLISAAYWADPSTFAHLGYAGPIRFP